MNVDQTERNWAKEKSHRFRQSLLSPNDGLQLDYSKVKWFDLFPLLSVVRNLIIRNKAGFPPVSLKLPHHKSSNTQLGECKALNFLVDIGFIGIAMNLGMPITIDGRKVFSRGGGPPGSSFQVDSRKRPDLTYFGYNVKEYSDKILIPITQISSEVDVERLRSYLWKFIKTSLRYVEESLDDGSFVDTFFRELSENAIEHGVQLSEHTEETNVLREDKVTEKAVCLVSARLLRPIWDLSEDRHESARRIRQRTRSSAMASFLMRYRDHGYAELVVADSGPGIHQTLSVESTDFLKVVENALDPGTSSLSLDDRLERGRSHLTGLGACRYCLERLPSLMIFRESQGSVSVERGSESGLRLSRVQEEEEALAAMIRGRRSGAADLTSSSKSTASATRRSNPVFGCMVQVALAIAPTTRRGKSLNPKSPRISKLKYFRLDKNRQSWDKEIRVLDRNRAGNSAILLDVSSVSTAKDPAADLLKSISQANHGPVVLCGVSASLLARLYENLKPVGERNRSQGHLYRRSQAAWLCVSDKLSANLLRSGEATPDEDALEAFVNLRQPRVNQEREWLVQAGALSSKSGGATYRFSSTDIIFSIREGISEWIVDKIRRDYRYLIIQNTSVKLPNGRVVEEYFDLANALRESEIRATMLRSLCQAVEACSPEVVVTYSAIGRQLVSELIRNELPHLNQVDFPDPYTPAVLAPGLNNAVGRRAVVVGDAVHTGGHIRRILKSCQTVGVRVQSAVTLVYSASDTETTSLTCGLAPVIKYPLLDTADCQQYDFVIDPYSLSLEPSGLGQRQEGDLPFLRTSEAGKNFYNTMRNQKALISGHCVHRSGRHFTLAVDFRQLLKSNFESFIIDALLKITRPCDTLVTPEESVVSSIAPKLSKALGIKRWLIAIAANDPGRHYKFSSEDAQFLRNLAKKKCRVLILEDAISTGAVFQEAVGALASFGVNQIDFCVILNNTPPGRYQPSVVKVEGVDVELSLSSIYRSFFPVFRPSTCPHCRSLSILRRASRSCPNELISFFLRNRAQQLEPVDIRGLVADPTRCKRISEVQFPISSSNLGVPKIARCAESLEFGLEELCQSDQGLVAISRDFADKKTVDFNLLVVRVLSRKLPGLTRLGYVDSFFERYYGILASCSGPQVASLLESALLWPIEILTDAAESLLAIQNPSVWNFDSSIAALYSLLFRIVSESEDSLVEEKFEQWDSFAKSLPEDSLRSSVVGSVFGMFPASREAAVNIHSAWKLLGSRLLTHRRPRHRIIEKIPSLFGVEENTAENILGLTDRKESLPYMALMLCVADVKSAIELLIEHGEIRASKNTIALCSKIDKAIKIRYELRCLYEREILARDSEKVENLISQLKSVFREIHSLLSPDSMENVRELQDSLKRRILRLGPSFVLRLIDALSDSDFECELVDVVDLRLSNLHVLADPYLLERLSNSIHQNIVDNVPKQLFDFQTVSEPVKKVRVEYEVYENGLIKVVFENICTEVDALDRFYSGGDYFHLNGELLRYGGKYSASQKGDRFLTEVTLQVV